MRFYMDNPSYHAHTGGIVDPTSGEVLVKPGVACFIFRWDDGTPVTGNSALATDKYGSPHGTALKWCTTEDNRDKIMRKLDRLEKSARKGTAQAEAGATKAQVQAAAAPADKKDGNVPKHILKCKDGTVVVMENCNIIFVPPNKGRPHGIMLEGKNDKDYAFVQALIGLLVDAGKSGVSDRMTGKELLEMDPTKAGVTRSPGMRFRPLG